MKPCVDIGAQNWVAAGPLTFPLQNLRAIIGDRFSRVAALIIDFVFDITTGVGGGCTGREIEEWVSNILLKTKYNSFLPGMNARQHQVLRVLQGFFHDQLFQADIAASQVNDISGLRLVIPFERGEFADGRDLSEPASRLVDGNLVVVLGAAALNADTTINAVSIKVHAEISRSTSLKAPLFWEDNAIQGMLSGQSLPPGLYSELGICQGAAFGAAGEITNARIVAGGEEQLASNDPDNVIGQFLFDNPLPGMSGLVGGHNWTKDFATLAFFPLLWMKQFMNGESFSDVTDCMGMPLSLDSDGTMTPVYVFRRYNPDSVKAETDTIRSEGGEPSSARVFTPSKSGGQISSAAKMRTRGATMIPSKITGFTTVAGAGPLGSKIPIIGK